MRENWVVTSSSSEAIRELFFENRLSMVMYSELMLAFDDYMLVYGKHPHPALYVSYDLVLFWQRTT